jgi:hypothetical protein
MREPFVESVCEHNGGNLSLIADWILDCLDRTPPMPGQHLSICLTYNSEDRGCFASSHRTEELTQAILRSYQREMSLGAEDYGEMRFGVAPAKASKDTSLLLTSSHEPSKQPVEIHFHWYENDLWARHGTLNLTRRHVVGLPASTRLTSSLKISGADIAPHVDRWQRSIRQFEPVVYFPEGRTTLVAGNMPGSDLLTDSLIGPIIITYDSDSDLWKWFGPDNNNGISRSPLNLVWNGNDTGPALSVLGNRLRQSQTAAAISAINKPEQFTLSIMGFALPRPQPRGYGRTPHNAPNGLTDLTPTAIQLPNGDWVYFNEHEQRTYILSGGRRLPGQAVQNGGLLSVGTVGGEIVSGEWQENEGQLPDGFVGELTLTKPTITRLAFGPISEKLPHDLFPEYQDSILGRAQVYLRSSDGHTFSLLFRESALHPIFIVHSTIGHHNAKFEPNEGQIDLGAGAEFIMGATHYCVRNAAI